MKLINLLILLIISLPSYTQGPYAPPAGQSGTTAMHKDSSAFIGWATDAVINRGYMNISNPNNGHTTTGNENSAIGKADGNVVSLGDSGYATMTFPGFITNGPGPDFAVFENSFSDDFLELGFVEVSSDGNSFFRFEAVSLTQDTDQVGTFGLLDATNLYNLAGKYRAQYGVPFDLEELAGTQGLNTDSITHIRITDVIGSIDSTYASYDSQGNKVNDPWPTDFESGGFDLDAVGIINCLGCPATGVEMAAKSKKLSVFPNPARIGDKLNIYWKGKEAMLEITDLRGKTSIIKSLSQGQSSLILSSFSPGIYLLIVKNDSAHNVQKLLITR